MKKLLERLLVFFVGLPLFAALVLFVPWRNHLALNVVIVILCALGGAEFGAMLEKKGLSIKKGEAFFMGALVPFAETASTAFFVDRPSATFGLIIIALSWILVKRVFSREEKLENALNHIAAGISVLAYPGLFIIPLIRMGSIPHSRAVLLAFLVIVFGNDSLAWAAGLLFGKNNRGVVPASPNKSVAGFAGGLLAAVGAGFFSALFVPEAFEPRFFQGSLAGPSCGAALGLISGVAASAGDLAESAIKRSAGVKDSGAIIPGRGGVLDSLDSVAFAAPVFLSLYSLLFQGGA